ncbi:MAG: hypothetical protein ACK55I_14285, partial [bacterium]
MDHFVAHAVFEDRVAYAFLHKGRVDTQAHSFFVCDRIRWLQPDRLGEAYPLELRLERFARGDASVFD